MSRVSTLHEFHIWEGRPALSTITRIASECFAGVPHENLFVSYVTSGEWVLYRRGHEPLNVVRKVNLEVAIDLFEAAYRTQFELSSSEIFFARMASGMIGFTTVVRIFGQY